MRLPKFLYLLFIVALVGGLLPLTTAAQPAAHIQGDLLDRLQAEGSANFFVKMDVDADLSAAFDMDWEARGWYVWNALNEVAEITQAPVVEYAQRHGLDYTSMLTTNSVFIRGGDLAAAQDLARLPGVAYLKLEEVYFLDPIIEQDPENGIQGPVAWGVIDAKGDQVWSEFGIRGEGIKQANIDTGVQWNHPALVNQFACPGDPGNAACWSDPSNICPGGTACDNNGHGTHVMGSQAGLDDPALTWQAGMAPGSTWIACKGCESSSCSQFALNSCADWIVAPGGSPNNRPHIVNNSWGGGSACDGWYWPKVNAWRAAGVFPAFSAGNSGSGCNTLGQPSNYQDSFATAAHASNRTIASFSSRGPAPTTTYCHPHTPYTKPNISSPGVSVCSSVPTNGWSCGYSGTSMSSPHTAGAVALVWSACPDLIGDMAGTFETLQDNADTPPAGNCGAPPTGNGNYTFGYGYLNALAAVDSCFAAEFGTLEGYVLDQNNQPVEGATVTAVSAAEGNAITADTDPNGYYTMQLRVGTYDVTASKALYIPETAYGVEIELDEVTQQDFQITYAAGTLQGYVRDQNNAPIAGATVTAMPGNTQATTDPNGFYSMLLAAGTYDVTATATGYLAQTVTGVVVVANQTTNQNFQLSYLGQWVQAPRHSSCPDWQRFDGAYFPATGKVYFLGGRSGSTFVGTIVEFDPVTQQCTNKANMPTPVANYTIAAINDGNADLLCTFGQSYTTANGTNRVQCYNPLTNTVIDKAVLPSAYITCTAPGASCYNPGGLAVVDNKVYLFGGFRSGSTPYHIAHTFMYDPLTDEYTNLNAPLSSGRAYMEVAVVDGKIYAFGGSIFDGSGLVNQTVAQVFDPAVGQWQTIAPLPSASSEGRAFGFHTGMGTALDGKIVLAGGVWSAPVNLVRAYDTATNTYDSTFPNLNQAKRSMAWFYVPSQTEAFHGRMWVYGGRAGADTAPHGIPEYYDVPAVAPPPPEGILKINRMKLNWRHARPPWINMAALVRVFDGDNAVVEGAVVYGEWTLPDDTVVPGVPVLGETDALGREKFQLRDDLGGLYKFCVTDITKAGYLYDPDQNMDGPCVEHFMPPNIP